MRRRARPPGRSSACSFKLSKYAAVGVTLNQGAKNYIYEKQSFFAGTRAFSTPKLKVGTYSLTMSVTDPVGHYAKLTTGLQVCKRTCPAAPYAIQPTTGTPPTVTVPIPKPTKTGTTTTPTTTTPTTTSTTTTTDDDRHDDGRQRAAPAPRRPSSLAP